MNCHCLMTLISLTSMLYFSQLVHVVCRHPPTVVKCASSLSLCVFQVCVSDGQSAGLRHNQPGTDWPRYPFFCYCKTYYIRWASLLLPVIVQLVIIFFKCFYYVLNF